MVSKINGFMIDYKIYKVFLCYFFIILLGCESKILNENVVIHRFENEFYNSSENDLQILINKYPYLFPSQFPTENWKSFLKDSTRLSVFKRTSKVFEDLSKESKEMSQIFNRLENIFPKFTKPKVITLNSQTEYENRIIYADSLLLISLDSYLGSNFYPDLPEYLSFNMKKEYISNDISEKISKNFIQKATDRTLLSEMIYHGKILFLNRHLTPFNQEYLIFHSAQSKIKWAEDNEFNIWSFFIENDLLFSTRNDLKSRFISSAPFSKFNLDIDKKSPGSIGKWIGYKIVNSYMNNNNITINNFLIKDYYEIFMKSKYKPKKK